MTKGVVTLNVRARLLAIKLAERQEKMEQLGIEISILIKRIKEQSDE